MDASTIVFGTVLGAVATPPHMGKLQKNGIIAAGKEKYARAKEKRERGVWFFYGFGRAGEGRITGRNAFDVPDRRTARAPVMFEYHPIYYVLLCFLRGEREQDQVMSFVSHSVVICVCV